MNLLRVSFIAGSHKTFRHMLRSSDVNIMIRGFATTSGNLESEQVVEKMNSNTLMNDISKAEELSLADRMRQLKRSSPNKTTYRFLIDSFCKHDRFDLAYKLLNEMIVSGFSPSFVNFNDVISGFIRIGDIRNAYEMHKKMNVNSMMLTQCLTDEVTYTSLMNAFLDEGKFNDAYELYMKMDCLEEFLDDNNITHINCLPQSVIHSVYNNGLDNKARTTEVKKNLLLEYNYVYLNRPILELHRTLAENCSEDEFKCLVELVEHFCNKGLANAYDTMLKSNYYKPDGIDDEIVYNLFVIAHCRHNNVDEAYIMYKEMLHNGFACHMFTVFALIDTLGSENMVNELLWVMQNVLRSCNLDDSEIVKFLNEFNPKNPRSEALCDVLAEKAKDWPFLKCSYAPASA